MPLTLSQLAHRTSFALELLLVIGYGGDRATAAVVAVDTKSPAPPMTEKTIPREEGLRLLPTVDELKTPIYRRKGRQRLLPGSRLGG
ncbi:unnamed protein product [Linum trigynum]|uniref:Uncharacterized protein n=1 Tax=Linum trigynum TaxID=586398 RepID=A0AAV2EB12_9ROSI